MKYKKYENFSEIQPHQNVKILSDDLEWSGNIGVVERVVNTEDDCHMAIVFCMEKLDCRYFVFPWNLDR